MDVSPDGLQIFKKVMLEENKHQPMHEDVITDLRSINKCLLAEIKLLCTSYKHIDIDQ